MFVQTYVQPACTWPCLYSGRHRFATVCGSQERSFVSWKQWTPDKAQDTLPGPSPHRIAPLWISSQHPGASFQRGSETMLETCTSFGAEGIKETSWERMCDSQCRLSIFLNWGKKLNATTEMYFSVKVVCVCVLVCTVCMREKQWWHMKHVRKPNAFIKQHVANFPLIIHNSLRATLEGLAPHTYTLSQEQ